jgi:hypothetical protein
MGDTHDDTGKDCQTAHCHRNSVREKTIVSGLGRQLIHVEDEHTDIPVNNDVDPAQKVGINQVT